MQRTNHGQTKRTLPVHDFGNLALALEEGKQGGGLQTRLIQAEANGFDGIGRGDGEMGFLVAFHEQRPKLEFGGIGRGLVHQALDVGEGRFVFAISFEDFGFHDGEWAQAVVASILA